MYQFKIMVVNKNRQDDLACKNLSVLLLSGHCKEFFRANKASILRNDSIYDRRHQKN